MIPFLESVQTRIEEIFYSNSQFRRLILSIKRAKALKELQKFGSLSFSLQQKRQNTEKRAKALKELQKLGSLSFSLQQKRQNIEKGNNQT